MVTPDWMAGGRLAELVLALLCAEVLLLALVFRRRGGRWLTGLLANLFAGAGLLLALRAALLGHALPVIAGWLGVALAGHLLELALRLRR